MEQQRERREREKRDENKQRRRDERGQQETRVEDDADDRALHKAPRVGRVSFPAAARLGKRPAREAGRDPAEEPTQTHPRPRLGASARASGQPGPAGQNSDHEPAFGETGFRDASVFEVEKHQRGKLP